ncbi:response regulator [Cystobacter fuscus]|uniref:response regulator n=1 Tax=Cystobacter fuscus TaxID=43 RepID=UPI002B2FC2BF|nr:response regulator [Cystobacter fuscus]
MEPKRAVTILMADDDPDDRDFARSAMQESRLANELRFVEDGEELINYLRRLGRYANPKDSPRPGLILLDLNMPRKDGREALREIKSDPVLKNIPIVVLTTSKAEEDILRSYNLGANCFITKPVTFDGLVEVVKVLNRHWLQIVELPPETSSE